MKIACFAVLGVALATASVGLAQDRPTLAAPANSLYVGADGKYEAAPDTAVFQFNISVQESKAQAAYQRAAEAAEQVRQLLRSNQIDPQSAEIGFFALQPVYDYRDAKRKLVGYRVNTSVSLKLKDFAKVGPIVGQLSDLDVTESQTLNYTVENLEPAKARAVEDAYHKAHEEAMTLARAGGRSLGELFYASVDVQTGGVVVPMPMMAARAMSAVAGPPPPTAEFATHKITITAHVNALFLLK